MSQQHPLPSEQLGPAERLLSLVLNGSAHLWHNRPGRNVQGRWVPAKNSRRGQALPPGIFVPAAVELYGQLLAIYQLNADLMGHFASYALVETDWRDLKVASAALMLVQHRKGEPIPDDDGSVAFYDDDFRDIGEAMVQYYKKGSARMFTPKMVLRVAELLELEEIAEINRKAGFVSRNATKPALGRWKRAATRWLEARETNPKWLESLVKAGYKETVKKMARKVGYKPKSEHFFAVLGWPQKQAPGGHRSLGLEGFKVEKRERFDGLSEFEICETIEAQSLSFKEVMGRLPKEVGLTPAIMVTLLPSLSDRDLRQLTPTLEELGLLQDPRVQARWEEALTSSTDQRALQVAKNVQNEDLKQKLESAADHAVRNAVEAASEDPIHVMFLIDKSGSMEGAIEKSKSILTNILAGFPQDRLHIASFDSSGQVLVPKAATRAGIAHMLEGIHAGGGTRHEAAIHALHRARVRIPSSEKLVVLVIGDEAGEAGPSFASAFRVCGYSPAAMGLIVNLHWGRGQTVSGAAQDLSIPFSEVKASEFEDPYQVPRVLKAMLEAPIESGAYSYGLVQKVMDTKLLTTKQPARALQ